MSEKKATGIQKPLNVSAALAKIIGTKKGEQVTLSSKSKSPKFIQVDLVCYHRYSTYSTKELESENDLLT